MPLIPNLIPEIGEGHLSVVDGQVHEADRALRVAYQQARPRESFGVLEPTDRR